MSDPGLLFGTINLIGTDGDIAAQGYQINALATDTNWGNAVPIVQRIKSWLQDGSLAKIKGFDNRTINIRVEINADDSEGLALGSTALSLETKKTNLLTYTPPDGVGAPCVFPVVFSTIENVWDDFEEAKVRRFFDLKIEAKPFVRSSILTTVSVSPPAGTQTITSVDNCSSATGWAASLFALSGPYSPSGTLTSGTSGGKVFAQVVNSTKSSPTFFLRQTRTGLSSSLSSAPYVRIVATFTTAGNLSTPAGGLSFRLNNIAVPVAVQEGNVYWLDPTGLGVGSTLNSVYVTASYQVNASGNNTNRLEIDDVSKSNLLGTQATGRQSSRIIPIKGTERTECNLAIANTSSFGLGSVFVYTRIAAPDLLQPNLRDLLSSGNTQTPDATTISGFTSDLTNVHRFDIPASQLSPGRHVLMASVKHPTTAGTYSIRGAAKSIMGSTADAGVAKTRSITLPFGNAYGIFEIATFTLPTTKMAQLGIVQIELTAAGLVLDEAWLFNLDTGDLTHVIAGAGASGVGGPHRRVFLDAATLENPTRQVMVGHWSDRSDAWYASDIRSFGNHEVSPDAINIFLMTNECTAATIEASYYAQFASYVVDQ